MYTYDAVEARLPPEAQVVDDGLDSFNNEAADFADVIPIACFARLDSGEVIGGTLARRWGACCELQQMWVDDAHRAHGVGRGLMRVLEDHLRAHGCTLIFLETFSFQAPDFYRKCGFDVACEFEGFPNGVSKLIMQRTLS